MRQKTTPRARKKKTASSCDKTGLIAKKSNRAQSAGTKSILDNRSHRTIALIERSGSAAARSAVRCNRLLDSIRLRRIALPVRWSMLRPCD
jgi:hypothetical protein